MTTHINLLDWRQARRERRKKSFFVSLGAGVAAAAAVVGICWLLMNGQLEYQQARNSYLRTEIKEMDQKIKEIKNLERVRDNLLARIKVIENLQDSRTASVHFFDELVNTLPEGVSLDKVQQKGTNITIVGTAESNGRVSTYMKNLDASPWFTAPRLIIIKTNETQRRRIAHFTLRVKQLIKPADTKPADDGTEEDAADDGSDSSDDEEVSE